MSMVQISGGYTVETAGDRSKVSFAIKTDRELVKGHV